MQTLDSIEHFNLNFEIENASEENVDEIIELENRVWAPWLACSREVLRDRIRVFPDGQIIIKDSASKKIVAFHSCNRINFDLESGPYPTWDEVSGEPPDFTKTFVPGGNTLVAISMSIDPNFQGRGLAPHLIHEMVSRGNAYGDINLFIGHFRPIGYGNHRLKHQGITFSQYCRLKRKDGEPLDPWLRSLSRQSLFPLEVIEDSMIVKVPRSEFESLYINQGKEWIRSEEEDRVVYLTDQVGYFEDTGTNGIVYREPNLLGYISLT